MKKFLNYLKKYHIIFVGFLILSCSIIYILRENLEFELQTISYTNLVMLVVFVALLYNSIRKHYVEWSYIIYILSLFFTFNRFYDEDVFLQTFHFKLFYFACFIGVIVIIGAFYPSIKNVLMKISSYLGTWTDSKINKIEQYRKKREKRQNKKEKRDKTEKEENLNSNEPSLDIPLPRETGSDEEKRRPKEPLESLVNNNINNPILFGVILFLLLAITITLIVIATKQDSSAIKKITSENILTFMVSIVTVIMFIVFTAGIILSLLIKWIQIIIGIVIKQYRQEFYFIYAVGLFIVSQYFFDNISYGTEGFADLLLDGKLFTFPLILSILIPVFLIFTESIGEFIKSNKKVQKVVKKSKKKTLKIAKGVVEALLTFIEFVTSDYLTTIIKLTKEDIENDKKNAKEDKENAKEDIEDKENDKEQKENDKDDKK